VAAGSQLRSAALGVRAQSGTPLSKRSVGTSLTRAPVQPLQSGVAARAVAGERQGPPRMIQHKQEAFWFYRFLSIVYDHIINPGHWTEDMRDDALEPAQLNSPDLKVVDVGGGTGFTTLGVVEFVKSSNVTILDQSPHQLSKARQKPALADCTIVEGDAEDLPFPTDSCDRYVSAGRYSRSHPNQPVPS